jgi:Mrp family chromosome partitioning ATPase
VSRLYTAIERSNTSLVESDVKPPASEPQSDTEQSTGTAEPRQSKPLPEEPSDGGAATDVALEPAVVTLGLPSLLIDSSSSFRREIGLLHQSLTIMADRDLRSVLVCSAESGAGTSSIALNLTAYASEETTGKALLIEANFQRPYLRQWTNRAIEGLADFLANQGALEQYVRPTSTAGLDVLTAGRITEQSHARLLEGPIRYLLTELQDRYPLVVFDGAPVNHSLGTLELAKAVDGVILVARPNTLTSDVVRASTALDRVGANTLGFAFNDF